MVASWCGAPPLINSEFGRLLYLTMSSWRGRYLSKVPGPERACLHYPEFLVRICDQWALPISRVKLLTLWRILGYKCLPWGSKSPGQTCIVQDTLNCQQFYAWLLPTLVVKGLWRWTRGKKLPPMIFLGLTSEVRSLWLRKTQYKYENEPAVIEGSLLQWPS